MSNFSRYDSKDISQQSYRWSRIVWHLNQKEQNKVFFAARKGWNRIDSRNPLEELISGWMDWKTRFPWRLSFQNLQIDDLRYHRDTSPKIPVNGSGGPEAFFLRQGALISAPGFKSVFKIWSHVNSKAFGGYDKFEEEQVFWAFFNLNERCRTWTCFSLEIIFTKFFVPTFLILYINLVFQSYLICKFLCIFWFSIQEIQNLVG